MSFGQGDSADMKNRELLERISKAEDDLRHVITNRESDLGNSKVYSSSRTSELVGSRAHPSQTFAALEHEESLARDRWRSEIMARQSGLGLDSTRPLEQTRPAGSPHSIPIAREDVKGVAEAIMLKAADRYQNSLNVNSMAHKLAGTPYADFATWFENAVDMEGSDTLSIQQLDAVVGQYLQECSDDSTIAKAIQAGGHPESPFVEGRPMMGQATPMDNAVGTANEDLVSFIQHSKPAMPESPKRSALGKVLLHMTVEIGDGRSDIIRVHEGDDARTLADEFCQHHDLSVNVVRPLADHIKANLEKLRAPLASPKRAPQQPEVQRSMGPRVDGEAVGKRLADTPTRTPRMSMDPSKLMMPAAANFYDDEEDGLPDHLDELAMSPATTTAVRKMTESKNTAKMRNSAHAFSPTLDDRSRKTAERMKKSRSSKGDVFARLNREAEERRRKHEEAVEARAEEEDAKIQDDIKRERMLRGKNAANAGTPRSGGRKNVGLELYKQAEELENRRKKKCEDAQAEKIKKEQQFYESRGVPKGTPKISSLAKHTAPRVMKDWDGSEKKKRLDDMRKRQAESEMSECTFDVGATIAQSEEMGFGQRSQKLVNKLVQDSGEEEADRFEALYSDAKQRQLRTEFYDNYFPEEETFHPDIGSNKYRGPSDPSEDAFINRLTYSKQVTPAAELEAVDAATGQPLFHPRTGRAPYFNRNAADLPIGDYLYASALEQDEEKQRKRMESEIQMMESANTAKASANSMMLAEGVRRRRLREIFEMIDTDADGIIDPEAANMAGVQGLLPEDVANEIVPVVIGVAQPLDFEQFFQVLSMEHNYTQTGPRQYLVPERLRHLRAVEEYIMGKEGAAYNPTVSTKSRILAESQRKHRHGSLHDALSEEGQIWDERRRNASEQKAAEDLAKCTFMPNKHLDRVSKRASPNPDEVTRRLSQPTRRS